MSKKIVKIGCHSAFWGDSPAAAQQLVNAEEKLDYLVSDYLAEITMCILARSKKEARGGAGDGGFVQEFVDFVWKPLMKKIVEKNIKIVTNAGGMNPIGLKNAIERVAKEGGLQVRVAAITGDDIFDSLESFKSQGKLSKFSVSGEEEEFWNDQLPLMSANAYTGAFSIAEALDRGAQIVVTGRCVDSALALGPLIHEYKWKEGDYDLLSSGSLAGHIIECGCQATGGNFTDWKDSLAGGWENVGFPIVEVEADGKFVVTKPKNTGGIVTVGTVGEQLLYEIGDPARYVLPDVICDWTQVKLSQWEAPQPGRVRVEGAKGVAPSGSYKVSVTALDGFRINTSLLIGGESAADKARAVGKAIFGRVNFMLKQRKMEPFTETRVEAIGAEETYGPHANVGGNREILLRIAARHSNPKALSLLAREIAPSATSMAPGITGDVARPRPTPVIRFFSVLVPKDLLPITIHIGDEKFVHKGKSTNSPALPSLASKDCQNCKCPPKNVAQFNEEMTSVPLIRLCFGRSGDKGDLSNIGLLCRLPEYFPYVKSAVTAEAVARHMGHLVKGKVVRYELPGTNSLNFVLTKSLGGGGVVSMNVDRQGKTYAQMLLGMKVPIPKRLADRSASKL